MTARRCETCAKRRKWGGPHGSRPGCKVLTEPIGMVQDCWAWTDDPYWEDSVRIAVEKYAAERGEELANE
jgi:hypothetical protein